MNMQDKMQDIHHKYGVSEKANYEIEKFVEKLIENDRAEQLILHNVSGCASIIEKIDKLKRFDESGYGEGGGTSREYCEGGENIDYDEIQEVLSNYR